MNFIRISRPFSTFRALLNRESKYGVEEGHGKKNEFRKEKWIKKRERKLQTRGGDWRKSSGYNKNQQEFLLPLSNWSDVETQFPGAPSDLQKRHKIRELQLAQDVFDAYQLVQRAQNVQIDE